MAAQVQEAQFNFDLGTKEHPLIVRAHLGQPTFIVGKNGSGKSALIQRIVQINNPLMHYFPGARSVSLSADRVAVTEDSRHHIAVNIANYNTSSETRYRVQQPLVRNDAAIYDLQEAELAHKVKGYDALLKADDPAAHRLSLKDKLSPLARVNSILALANLPVQLEVVGIRLMANSGGVRFSLAKMSDGERSAVFLAAEIVTAQLGSLFIIDEPEVHLHKSIASPLIAALIAERRDCAFLVCTHDLELAASFNQAKVLIVRSVTWEGEDVARSWDIDTLEGASELSERDRADLMGARRRLLFVEGDETNSLDFPLYELLFPKVTIVPRRGCRAVKEAVAGLRANEQLHWLEAFGLIDNDGITSDPTAGVFQTGTNAIEGLYYSPAAIQAVAEAIARIQGRNAVDLIEAANTEALRCLNHASIDHLAARVAERRLRDAVLASMPDRDQMVAAGLIDVHVDNPYPNERARLQAFVDESNLAAVVSNYPIKFSGVRDAIARGLHQATRNDYERILLQQVSERLDLRNQLRQELGEVAQALGALELVAPSTEPVPA
jgi:ABC-type Mn2+/Zn2+ transport system ATPase subunit